MIIGMNLLMKTGLFIDIYTIETAWEIIKSLVYFIFLGGMPDVSQRTLKKFTSGYNGCLQDLTLAEDYRLQMVQSAQNGQNVLRCS